MNQEDSIDRRRLMDAKVRLLSSKTQNSPRELSKYRSQSLDYTLGHMYPDEVMDYEQMNSSAKGHRPKFKIQAIPEEVEMHDSDPGGISAENISRLRSNLQSGRRTPKISDKYSQSPSRVKDSICNEFF